MLVIYMTWTKTEAHFYNYKLQISMLPRIRDEDQEVSEISRYTYHEEQDCQGDLNMERQHMFIQPMVGDVWYIIWNLIHQKPPKSVIGCFVQHISSKNNIIIIKTWLMNNSYTYYMTFTTPIFQNLKASLIVRFNCTLQIS